MSATDMDVAIVPARSASTLTYLFTDVEGSTSQWETSPDMHERVEHHFAILRGCVVDAGGEVFATMGDGVGAAFASARAAVGAAIAAQQALPATGLRVRMGLHTGEALQTGDDYRGRALNRAARIMSAGHGRQILLSGMTAALVRTGPDPVDLLDLGVHTLRDLSDPEHVWQVTHPELESHFAPLRSDRAARASVPRHRTSFVGRGHEIHDVVERVRANPIVTLTGPGGAGKTRLALRAAFDAVADPDDVWFADLAPLTDPARVADVIARAAGIDGPTASDASLAAAIGTRRALLVLDNCEHVLDRAAAITDRLAADCRGLRVLATSREPLLIPGEFVVAVHGLVADGDAEELFAQRAAAAGAPIDPALRPVVTRICERLDGLPLAIELAAARVPMFGLHAVEALLDHPFDVLVTRLRGGDARHRTMRAAIDWSYRLLDAEERRLLEWLAVFRGGFELDAALDIAGRLGHLGLGGADHLDSLVRKSMIEIDDCTCHTRYRLVESIRAFALEQLDARGEAPDARRAHATWMADITATPFDDPISVAVERAAVRLEREAENWATALDTATSTSATDLIDRLCSPATAHFLVSRHDLTAVLERAAAVCPGGTPRRAVACALASACAGSADAEMLHSWNAELQRLDGPHLSGTTHLIGWMSHVWSQRTEHGVRWCIDGARNPRFSQDARDLFHGIATIDRFSLTTSVDDLDWLVEGALDVIDRTDVTANRVVCRLGVAWALADGEPGYAMQLVQEAADEIDALPHFMRSTLPGNIARFMSRIDPALGARYLLERIDEGACPTGPLDSIPVAYATALLDRVGHPSADVALASLAASPYGTYLARLDLDRRARHALLDHSPLGWCDLIALVRDGLGSLAANAGASAAGTSPTPDPNTETTRC